MQSRRSGLLMRSAVLLSLLVSVSSGAGAQTVRQRLMDRLLVTAEPTEVAEIAIAAANLALGAPDSLWAEAVIQLAQALLIDREDQEAAELWLRWATRYHPQLTEYDNAGWEAEARSMLSRVAQELGSAEADTSISTWDWSGAKLEGDGAFRLNRAALRDDVEVQVVQAGQLFDQLSLEPGTYDVQVVVDGEVLMVFQREVLPGVATVLNITEPVLAAADQARPAPIEGMEIGDGGGGGFPIAVAVAGAVGVLGAIAALLFGGSTDNGGGTNGGGTQSPTTGGIIIIYPIP